MRRLVIAALLISGAAAAAVTGEWQVNVKKGNTNQAPPASGKTLEEAVAACRARIPGTASTKTTYQCHNLRYVTVVTPDPVPPTCPPPAASSTRTQQCPAGTTGTWQQTSTSTVGPPPACTVTTTWAPSSPPAGACTTPQPPPSGDTIRNGELFKIVGSGFGTKPTAAPVVFDDFESGTGQLHNKPAVVGTWGGGEHSSPTYDTTQPLQGARVARHAFGGGIYNASLYIDRTTTTVYLDFWNRVVSRSTAKPGDPNYVRNRFTRNFKSWRFYGSGDSTVANEFVPCDSPGAVGPWIQGLEWEDRPWGKWEHYRVVYKSGSGGVFSQHRDGRADVEQQSNSRGQLLGIRLGHYWALDGDANCDSNPGADVYTDLVYVDTSLARVYLADGPNLAQAKHTAIQIPTAWADGAVTFTGNTHGFKTGDTAHIIVVNASNAERKTQPVTVQ